jgi:hypothetical protein
VLHFSRSARVIPTHVRYYFWVHAYKHINWKYVVLVPVHHGRRFAPFSRWTVGGQVQPHNSKTRFTKIFSFPNLKTFFLHKETMNGLCVLCSFLRKERKPAVLWWIWGTSPSHRQPGVSSTPQRRVWTRNFRWSIDRSIMLLCICFLSTLPLSLLLMHVVHKTKTKHSLLLMHVVHKTKTKQNKINTKQWCQVARPLIDLPTRLNHNCHLRRSIYPHGVKAVRRKLLSLLGLKLWASTFRQGSWLGLWNMREAQEVDFFIFWQFEGSLSRLLENLGKAQRLVQGQTTRLLWDLQTRRAKNYHRWSIYGNKTVLTAWLKNN